MNREELARLFVDMHNATLAPEDHRRLQDCLKNSPEARRFWFLYCDMEGGLADWALLRHEQKDQPPVPSNVVTLPQAWFSWAWRLAAAAAVVAVLVTAWIFFSRPGASQPSRVFVCQVQQAIDAKWASGSPAPKPGDNLRNCPLELASGMVEFAFLDGATVVVEGPAQFDLAEPDRLVMWSGKMAAEVPPRAVGFTVETPAGKIIDRGTRFGVNVASNGVTETRVFEGKVDVRPAKAGNGNEESVKQGGAVLLDPATASIKPAPPRPGLYPQPERVTKNLLGDGDFEPGARPYADARITKPFGRWHGDICQITASTNGIEPHTGSGMLEFVRGEARQDSKAPPPERVARGVSDLFQLVDLGAVRDEFGTNAGVVEVEAWFCTLPGEPDPTDTTRDMFSMNLEVFRTPAAAWTVPKRKAPVDENEEPDQGEQLVKNAGRFYAGSQPNKWHCLKLTSPLAPEAKSLLLHIGAWGRKVKIHPGKVFTGQYADSISVKVRFPPQPSSAALPAASGAPVAASGAGNP
ncbi:MAG TPA: FecR family protein [Candidatus Paceibacterota bacterium]|nr:FecR family protein [Candidatus Paceibacterota bacterium]